MRFFMGEGIKFRTKSESFIMNAPVYLGVACAIVLFAGALVAGSRERTSRYSESSRGSCSTNSIESPLGISVSYDIGNYDFRNRVPERVSQK
jgi:hypothetical protein